MKINVSSMVREEAIHSVAKAAYDSVASELKENYPEIDEEINFIIEVTVVNEDS